MSPPYERHSRYGFLKLMPELHDQSDTTGYALRSRAFVCEERRPLGPAHTGIAEVSEKGLGRFSHWGQGVFFSTSDNTDPNNNGRTYYLVFAP